MTTHSSMRDAHFEQQIECLARLTRDYHARGWTPATSSNFSLRLDADHCAVTASGGDKSTLAPEHMLIVDLDGSVVDGAAGARPSAETGLHTALYRRDPGIGAVLHTHAPNAVLTTRLATAPTLLLQEYELLKAFSGLDTHATQLSVPIIDNSQDITELAAAADQALDACTPTWGYLIAGHGIYAWGADLDSAARHLEALDYLLGLELELARMRAGPQSRSSSGATSRKGPWSRPLPRPSWTKS